MFAFSKEENVNVRNLARSRICTLVIAMILYLVIVVL